MRERVLALDVLMYGNFRAKFGVFLYNFLSIVTKMSSFCGFQ